MTDDTPFNFDASRLFPYDPRYTPAGIPSAGVFDAPLYQLCINAQWWSHVEGVIERLTWRDAWVGDPENQQYAADEAVKILETIGKAIACGETTLFKLRQSPVNPCLMEQSLDGGDTWTTAFNYALCSAITGGPTFNVELGISVINNNTIIYNGDPDGFRPELQPANAETDTAICHALELVIRASIAGLIERKRDEYTQEVIFIAVSGVLATATAFLFGGPVAGLGTAIGTAIGLIGNAIIDGVDDDDLQAVLASDALIDALVCCAYEALAGTRPTETAFSNALDFCTPPPAAVAILPALQAVFEDFAVFIQFLDAAGMAHQYATAGVLGNECETICDTWCRTFDFTIDAQGWTTYPFSVFSATYSPGVGWRPINSTGGGYNHRAASIQIDVPTLTNITEVQVEANYTKGTFNDVTSAYLVGTQAPQVVEDFILQGAMLNGTPLILNSAFDTTVDNNFFVFFRSSVRSSGTPNGDVTIKRVTLYGTGENPFGADNC